VSKVEPAQLDFSLAQAIQQIKKENTNISQKLFKICRRIMNQRQVSACESAYRLCHLPFRDSFRKCVFLNTRKPEQRYRVVKFDKVSKKATDYCANLFDFVHMCLLEFAMLFEPYYAKQFDDENNLVFPRKKTKKRLLTLRDNSKMIIRNITLQFVVRVPYFFVNNKPENYYYSLLVQYKPYRQEIQLLEGFDSSLRAFEANEEEMRNINKRLEEFRQLDHHLENAFNTVGAFDILERIPPPLEEIEEELPEQALSREQFERGLGAMNVTQRDIFESITSRCAQQLNGNLIRLKLFITGNAGTGKTFLFKILQFQINNCFGGRIVVKVCALTGVAARLVGGSTLHSSLRLPVQRDGVIVELQSLTGNYLEIMRREWKDIEFIFIDEVSMIPYEMFCMVDSRLKQLMNNDEIFGKINTIRFGDAITTC
jgi:PIF1-like helicase